MTSKGRLEELERRSVQSFCQRWIGKADQYDDQTLDGAFDRFSSLFVAFNRLYSYLNQWGAGRHVEHDREQATTRFSSIVGPKKLMVSLLANEGFEDMRALCDLLAPDSGFSLVWPKQKRNAKAETRKLYDDLHAGCDSKKVNALLNCLYHVRCNMFHGRKDFEWEQLQVIQPATKCLKRVVCAGLDTLCRMADTGAAGNLATRDDLR